MVGHRAWAQSDERQILVFTKLDPLPLTCILRFEGEDLAICVSDLEFNVCFVYVCGHV